MIKVLLIDTGVIAMLGLGGLVSPTTDSPSFIHGTQVAYIIKGKGLCDEVKITSCDYLKEGLMTCLSYASQYDFVNMSIQGDQEFYPEKNLIMLASNSGTIFTVASGNKGYRDIRNQKSYPASYKYEGVTTNFFVVGDVNFKKANNGPGVLSEPATRRVPDGVGQLYWGKGTSYSAPGLLNKMLTALCKERNNLDKEIMCNKSY